MRANLQAAFETKVWRDAGGGAPRSGPGSSAAETARLRRALPGVFRRYGVSRFLDAPCGDWHWMQTVDLAGISYVGGDISSEVIAQNQRLHARPGVSFQHLDVTSDPLPEADILLCRDCLMHLKHWLRWAFLENFLRSGIPYLMMTAHHVAVNLPVANNGGFKRFNPVAEPFRLPEPLEWIHETADRIDPAFLSGAQTAKEHRSVGIWSRMQVQARLHERATDLQENAATA